MRLSVRILFAALLALLVAGTGFAQPRDVALADLFPEQRHAKMMLVMNNVFERYHYRKLVLDEQFAAHILDNYLAALDPNRSFFLRMTSSASSAISGASSTTCGMAT